ncbi:MAG: lipoyl(octanoyl) transferase LipB [Proteobacteria bacterium]|nr:lipoyl(octanoyl) transferase LipB [Pseudomonadota bacterium]MDA1332045.1 lipoyl(octanoyl) transferase LipB [Pseudomonadota bacterium]
MIVKMLGLIDYEESLQRMREFTLKRSEKEEDELWVVEHPPVYTLGLKTKIENLPHVEQKIPLIQSDRGGQITYHGPGQIIIYTLLDLKRLKLSVKGAVRLLEQTVINLLSSLGIKGNGDEARPGIYVQGKKIASLGLKIRNGYSYHGVALNVDMDLSPFEQINPCGYANLSVTQLKDLDVNLSIDDISQRWVDQFLVSFEDKI